MGITRLEFMLFYSVLLVFIVYVSGIASVDILGGADLAGFPQPTGAWWADWTLPFVYFWTFINITTEFAIIFSLILLPFIIGVIVIIAEMIRGN